MRKNWLGRTGLEVSEIAFGGGVTGGILIKADEPTRISALMRAVEAGINLIDTAPLYGGGASEEAIGRHLAALEPRPYVSTKVLLEPDDLMDIRGAIERSLEQSLKRLRTDSGVQAAFNVGAYIHLVESAFDVVVQELKNIRLPFGDAKVDQTVPII
jgi:aryl-alcohol dehydrogenase-like predicted oxidoreductase